MDRCTERRWPVATRQIAVVSAALFLCPAVALIASRDAVEPMARAQALVDFEQRLGLFVEPRMHAWLQGHPQLLLLAGAFYVWVHVPAVLGTLAWLWLERPAAFRSARNWFLIAQALVVAGYLLMPTAPPRLLDGHGFRDTLTQVWGTSAATMAHTVQSPYAAMPSGHVAFAVLVGALLMRHGRAAALRRLGLAYPAVVTLVVLATANHFWVDALAGALVAAAGWWLVRAMDAARALPRVPAGVPAQSFGPARRGRAAALGTSMGRSPQARA